MHFLLQIISEITREMISLKCLSELFYSADYCTRLE